MRRLRPIPENYDSGEMNGRDGADPASLGQIIDELKGEFQRTRKSDRELIAALQGISESLAQRSNGASPAGGTAGGPPLRLGVFADTANLTDRVNENPTVFDYKKLLEWVVGNRRVVHARAYCPVYTEYAGRLEEQRTVAPVWGKGYDIVTKPVKMFADGTRKADLDLVLAVDVIKRIDTMDVLALMSGDGDFVPVVEMVREKGVRVELYCFVESLAEELRLAADAFYDIHQMAEVHVKSSKRSA